MRKDIFTEGVYLGGLNDRQEIKILICFILDKLSKPLKKSDITSTLQNYGLANYFEASQAFSEMVDNNNIAPDENNEGYYVITESGKMIVKELSGTLPATVKEKALKSANTYLERIKSEQENKVSITKNSRGYNVTCCVSDGEFDMLELTLYAPDINMASVIRDNFYKDPSEIYYSILSLLAKGD
jgi:predicted transcriptional regulator